MAFLRHRFLPNPLVVVTGLLVFVAIVKSDVDIPNLGTVSGKVVHFVEDKFIGVDTEIHAYLVWYMIAFFLSYRSAQIDWTEVSM